jgi:MFS family permease
MVIYIRCYLSWLHGGMIACPLIAIGGLFNELCLRFLLGIGIGAEYPCGSVAASEQSEEPGISKNAQHRWFVLATSE